MLWGQQPKKDVASDEMLRGAASRLRSGDLRMGQPGGAYTPSPVGEDNSRPGVSGRTETSQYSEEEKTTPADLDLRDVIPQVAASERGTAQTLCT